MRFASGWRNRPGAVGRRYGGAAAWGFRYETLLARTRRPDGYGKYWLQHLDLLLLGVRGNLSFRDSGLPNLLEGQADGTADDIRSLVEQG